MCVEMVQLRCEMQAPEEVGLKSNLAIQRAGVYYQETKKSWHLKNAELLVMFWASSICYIFFHSRGGQKLILKVTDQCFVIICFQCLGYKKKTKPNSKGGKKAVSDGSNNPSILLCQALLYSYPVRRHGSNPNVEAAAQPRCCHRAWQHREHTVMSGGSLKVP